MPSPRSIALLARAGIAALALVTVPSSAEAAITAASVGGCATSTVTRTLNGTPANYTSLVSSLQAGDRLVLAGGNYTNGITLNGKNGVAGRCIQIEGPTSGTPATFLASSSRNTISIQNSSYLVIKNLVLDGRNYAVDGLKAEATSTKTHHITVENLLIKNHGNGLWTTGINTKCPSWNWVIRRNTILGAGIGLYLGKPDGTGEFVNGLIENNLVKDTRQYNMQIKHQISRNTGIGVPTSGKTVIRHNVWAKGSGGATGADARPNVLVGHWPLSGAGANDVYLIYGNFFWQNPTEGLFQGEGNVAFYANLMVNDGGRAVAFQKQNSVPRNVSVFRNTIIARDEGIGIRWGSTAHTQRVIGNAVFAGSPINGGLVSDNVTDSYPDDWQYLMNPDGVLGGSSNTLSLFPKPAMLYRPAHSTTGLTGFEAWNLDFNGRSHSGNERGAYGGEGTNPGWRIGVGGIKPPFDAGADPGDGGAALFINGLEAGNLSGWSVG